MNAINIAKQILKTLLLFDLKGIVTSATDKTVIIKFEDSRMCSIIISDHENSQGFQYKFNVRSDIKESVKVKNGNVWRCYYTVDNTNEMILDLVERNKRIKTWTKLPPWENKNQTQKLSTKNI